MFDHRSDAAARMTAVPVRTTQANINNDQRLDD